MKTPHNTAIIFFLTLSFAGLILISALTNLSSAMEYYVSWRKHFIGVAFSIVCVLGILAGISPSKCSNILHFRRSKQREINQESTDLSKKALSFRGHHPDCGSFRAHIFQVGDKVFCAGCVGLILGAFLSLFGVVPYFFADLSFGQNSSLLFSVGFVGVSIGLLQYHLFKWGKSLVHLFVNTFFVFGVFLLLVGADGMTQSLIVDSYLVVLSIFWLYTRILLSQLEHNTVCTKCPVNKCEFCQRKSMEKS